MSEPLTHAELLVNDLRHWYRFLLRERKGAGDGYEAPIHIDHLTACAVCIDNATKAVAALTGERDALREALQQWIAWREAAERPLNNCISLAAIHGGRYTGPTYTAALEASKAALAGASAPVEPHEQEPA